MNVRFSEQALRCRVTRAELDRLLTGGAIVLEVALPRDHIFRINVRPTTLNGWQFDTDPTGVWLTIPRTALESLSQSLPATEGIGQTFPVSNGGCVAVSFGVDLRK